MKLIRFGALDKEKPGVILNGGKKIDVSAFVKDYDEDFFGNEGIEKLDKWLKKNASNCPEISNEERLGSPLARPSKLVCVGFNWFILLQ